MARKKIQEERWVNSTEALAILRKNSGRDDIPESYVRTLAYPRRGKPPVVASRPIDGRTKEYRLSDLEHYVVRPRDKGKGDTVAARAAGSRRKQSNVSEQVEQDTTESEGQL